MQMECQKEYRVGDKIECVFPTIMKRTAFSLSSKGYGVAIIGLSDIEDHILTITELPKIKECEE